MIMVRTKKRMGLCLTLLCLLLIFIWGNSLMPDTVSRALSQWAKRILDGLFGGGDSAAQDDGDHFLRKLAHFTEFCCLGMCLTWLFAMVTGQRWQHAAMPLVCGTLVASLDESIQYFVPGRACRITDVGIDTLGAALGIVLINLHILFIKKSGGKKT